MSECGVRWIFELAEHQHEPRISCVIKGAYPYCSHPSTSTAPPVPQEYQNAPTAKIEKMADPNVRKPSKASLRARLMVKGEVKVR